MNTKTQGRWDPYIAEWKRVSGLVSFQEVSVRGSRNGIANRGLKIEGDEGFGENLRAKEWMRDLGMNEGFGSVMLSHFKRWTAI